MAVPVTITDLSTTVSSNSPAGTDAIGTSLDDYLRAIQAIIKESGATLYTATGTDTITVTTTPTFSAYATGQKFWLKTAAANTGAVTINFNAIGAKAITKNGTQALIANDLTSGAIYQLTYDGTQFQCGDVSLTGTGATTTILVGGGVGSAPVWTTATGTGSPVRGTSPTITTSLVTGDVSFTALAGATTLLTIGGTGASASMFAPSTLDATSSVTGAIRTSGGISAAKAVNVGTTLTVAGHCTLEGVTSTGATGTAKFVFDTTPTINTAILLSARETRTAPTISAGTLTLDLSLSSVFDVSLNAAVTTLTISNPVATGTSHMFVLTFTADGTARAVTWPAAILWPSATAPTLTSTNLKKDKFVFHTTDGGATYHAFTIGQNL